MNVLQLCHKPSFPVLDGGCLAINQISQAIMAVGHDLSIISIATLKHPFKPELFPKDYLSKTNYKPIFVDTTINVVDAFSNLVTADAYHVSRFFSSDVDKAIAELLSLKNFDIVICESIYVAPYISTIRKYTKAKILLRSHNLEFSIWHRLARSHRAGLKKAYLKILTKQLRSYEIALLDNIDGLIAINADEMKHYRRLGFKRAGITIPFGIDPENYVPNEKAAKPNTVFHLGSMDWKPNEEGIEWFLEDIWPLVARKNKKLELHLAGRNMPGWLSSLKMKNVVIDGEVSDAQRYMSAYDIMVVPLLSGGGMRVKMVEALAMEKPVVSTTLGAKGVAIKNGKNALIARGAPAFAEAICKLASDENLRKKIAEGGRALVLAQYNNALLTAELNSFLNTIQP